jgi:hypothetical protein
MDAKHFISGAKQIKFRNAFLFGRFPDFSVEQARNKALEIAFLIAKGENPHDERKEEKLERTLGNLFEEYLNGHVDWRQLHFPTDDN